MRPLQETRPCYWIVNQTVLLMPVVLFTETKRVDLVALEAMTKFAVIHVPAVAPGVIDVVTPHRLP